MSRSEVAELPAAVPPSLEEVRERLAVFCRQDPIQKLEIFGSVARGEQEPGSDVDLMVTFAPGSQISFERYLEMKEEVQRLLGCPVDFVERQSVERHDNEIR